MTGTPRHEVGRMVSSREIRVPLTLSLFPRTTGVGPYRAEGTDRVEASASVSWQRQTRLGTKKALQN